MELHEVAFAIAVAFLYGALLATAISQVFKKEKETETGFEPPPCLTVKLASKLVLWYESPISPQERHAIIKTFGDSSVSVIEQTRLPCQFIERQ